MLGRVTPPRRAADLLKYVSPVHPFSPSPLQAGPLPGWMAHPQRAYDVFLMDHSPDNACAGAAAAGTPCPGSESPSHSLRCPFVSLPPQAPSQVDSAAAVGAAVATVLTRGHQTLLLTRMRRQLRTPRGGAAQYTRQTGVSKLVREGSGEDSARSERSLRRCGRCGTS